MNAVSNKPALPGQVMAGQSGSVNGTGISTLPGISDACIYRGPSPYWDPWRPWAVPYPLPVPSQTVTFLPQADKPLAEIVKTLLVAVEKCVIDEKQLAKLLALLVEK